MQYDVNAPLSMNHCLATRLGLLLSLNKSLLTFKRILEGHVTTKITLSLSNKYVVVIVHTSKQPDSNCCNVHNHVGEGKREGVIDTHKRTHRERERERERERDGDGDRECL